MKIQKAEIATSHLLVEGKDDFHVVSAICHKYNLPENFEIVPCDGIDKLLGQIPIRIKLKDRRLGILVDADIDLEGRWQQLVNLLVPLGYKITAYPNPNGSIFSSTTNECIVGIWIMPDNRTSGMIEDFTRILIPKEDLLRPYAETVLSDIGTAGLTRFRETHRSKALIHTWLAWQEVPGTPMGQAITKSYLNHNHELCLKLVRWLNVLFGKS